MWRLTTAVVPLLLLLSFSISTAAASPGIRGPVQNVPTPDIEVVLLKPQTSTVFEHHFMCIYIWTGKEWIIGTAGFAKNSKLELDLCRENFEENTAHPDFVLTREEYLEWELQYYQALAKRGVGTYVGLIGGMIATPFTLGHTKMCYLETTFLSSLAESVTQQGKVTTDP